MIVRDESQHLQACLQSVQALVNQIILVDTGSKDNTLEIARGFKAQIFEIPWVNDFAAARNHALKQAQCEWIMTLDADERLAADAPAQIEACLAQWHSSEHKVHNFLALSPGKKPLFTRGIFPNLKGIHFQGRVHEYLCYKGNALKHEFHPEIKILRPPVAEKHLLAKHTKYLPLILQELEEAHIESEAYQHYIWHLALCYETLKMYPQAYEVWLKIWRKYQAQSQLDAFASATSLEKLLQHLMPLMLQFETSQVLQLAIPEWFKQHLPQSSGARHALAHVLCLQGDYQNAYQLCYETLATLRMTEQMQAEFGKMAAWAKGRMNS